MPTFKPQYKDKNGIIQDLNIDYNSLANKPTTKNEIESLKSNINTLDKRVTSIESRLSDRIFKVDSDIAYTKTVPTGALPYASIDMIGGNVVKEPLTNRAKVLGETIKWNQLFYDKNITILNSCSVVGTKITITTDVNNKSLFHFKKLKTSHKYLFISTFDYNAYGVGKIRIYGESNILYSIDGIFTADMDYAIILTISNDYIIPSGYSFDIYCIDLTDIFGAGNEPTDDNSPEVQELISYAQSHPEYDEGSVRSVELNEVEYCGENIWDEQWEVGGLNVEAGNNYEATDRIRGKNYCDAIPNTTYFIKSPDNIVYVVWYDANKKYISYSNGNNSTIVSPNNARYFKLAGTFKYGTTYNNDICINVSNDAINGTYFPYNGQKVVFSQPISLNGLETKDELYSQVEGNELVSYKLQRYGKVDLGTLDWFYEQEIFMASLTDAKRQQGYVIPANILCAKYKTDIWSNTGNASYDKIIAISYASNHVGVDDSTYTDLATFKTAMQGVMLVYELATPTITEISRVPLTCNFEQVENVLFNSVLGSTELEKGVLKAQCTEKVVSIGVNIWDEQWEVGSISTKTGEEILSYETIRSANPIRVIANTVYSITKPTSKQLFILFYDGDDNAIQYVAEVGDTVSVYNISALCSLNDVNVTFTTPSGCMYIKFRLDNTVTYNNDICINVSNDAINGTYFPYKHNNFLIPSSIQSLEGYGWGVNDSCYNYIDFEGKKFVKRVGRVDLGTLNWEYGGGVFASYLLSVADKGLSTKYERVDTVANENQPNNTIQVRTGIVYIKDTSYTDATTFKTAMNGIILYYELATPVITDISNILTDDNFIKVEPYGTLTFENTNKKAVPSKIAYLVEVK